METKVFNSGKVQESTVRVCVFLHTQVCPRGWVRWWRAAQSPGFFSHSAWGTSGYQVQVSHSLFHIPEDKQDYLDTTTDTAS